MKKLLRKATSYYLKCYLEDLVANNIITDFPYLTSVDKAPMIQGKTFPTINKCLNLLHIPGLIFFFSTYINPQQTVLRK